MAVILPVASGKGGTGKTVLCANLGVTLAQKGKDVILADLDLGGANLHTCLGIRNDHPGIGDYIYKHVESLHDIILTTPVLGLKLIPGDVLLPGTANLDYGTKKKIIRNISKLDADFIILDLGAGTTFNTVDFFLMSSTGMIVTTPETTSILNAYAFIKAMIFRLLFLSFPPASDERKAIFNYLTERIESKNNSFSQLVEIIMQIRPESGVVIKKALLNISPRIVINMGLSISDIGIGEKLKVIVRKNLGMEIRYIGFLPKSNDITLSIIKRQPACLLSPGSIFSKSMNILAEKIVSTRLIPNLTLYESENDDLEALQKQVFEMQHSEGVFPT
jgi:flagellar biosynthesis protein FlhG